MAPSQHRFHDPPADASPECIAGIISSARVNQIKISKDTDFATRSQAPTPPVATTSIVSTPSTPASTSALAPMSSLVPFSSGH
jgi:hypothetical protein